MHTYIKQVEFIKSCASKKDWVIDDVREVVFLGRSNVGKSSFINAFTNRRKLAKVSQTPGKTRLLNLFSINNNYFRLVDSPGYGFSKINYDQQNSFIKMMDDYLTNRENLKLSCLLLDMRRIPNNDDIAVYNMLKKAKHKVLIIGTKQDKLKKNEIKKNINLIKQTLTFEDNDDFIPTSSLDKINIETVIKYIFNFFE